MKNTRRTFLQSLAAIPLLGWAFASAKPAMPLLPHVKVDTSEPVYGFDERLMLSDVYVNVSSTGRTFPRVFLFGEKVECGDFVVLNSVGQIVKAEADNHPVGMATARKCAGDEAQDYVLIRRRVT